MFIAVFFHLNIILLEVLVHSKDCYRQSTENKTGNFKIQRTSLVGAISQQIKSSTSTSCKEYKNINKGKYVINKRFLN